MELKENGVDKRSKAVTSMLEGWELVDDVLGGTAKMREANVKRLPKFPQESAETYATRLSMATMFPAYSKTCSNLAARPFSRPITLSDDMAPEIRKWMANVDRQGRNLEQFAAAALEVGIAYGQSHIVIDFPVNRTNGTVQAEREAGLRPYLLLVKPTQLLGWRATQDGVLRQVRYMETIVEDDGEFGEKEVQQIRVLTPNYWQVWRKVDTPAKWALHDQGVITLGAVPFVTVYGRRIAFMTSRPPMEELAYMNVKHWQSQSDQDNILHIARVPILKATGVDETFQLTIGTQAAVTLPPGADLGFAEHSGAAIGSGKVSLDDLKEEMRQAGAEMLVQRPGPRTATEIKADTSANMSDLQRIVQDLEDALDLSIETMAKWARQPLLEDGYVTVFNEFSAADSSAESVSAVLQASAAGILSKRSTFNELQRRAVINSDLDWDEEQDLIDSEGPPEGKIDPATGLPYTQPAKPPET